MKNNLALLGPLYIYWRQTPVGTGVKKTGSGAQGQVPTWLPHFLPMGSLCFKLQLEVSVSSSVK